MNASYSVPYASPTENEVFSIKCNKCSNTQPIETKRFTGHRRQQKGKEIFIEEDNRDSGILVSCKSCGSTEYI